MHLLLAAGVQAVKITNWPPPSPTATAREVSWTDIATALATGGLLVVAIAAGWIALVQYLSFKRASKIRATTDLIEEWSRGKIQSFLGLIDYFDDTAQNRKLNLRAYRLFKRVPAANPGEGTKQLRKRIRKRQRAAIDYHDLIETISLVASRTWNLLDKGLIDEAVLFGQLDYDIASSYYELEEVLAVRSAFNNYLYDDYTKLARRALAHYQTRPYREIVGDLAEAVFYDLPGDEEDYGIFQHRLRRLNLINSAVYFMTALAHSAD